METGRIGEKMILNWGPAHPVTHGVLRVLMKLEGEVITESECEIGYLHRGFEKMAENLSCTQIIPLTDRLNYVSPFMNNVAFCLAVERLLELEIPEKAKTIRVMGCEMSRIMDHLVCLAANILDLAALTPYWYLFNFRERFYDIFEEIAGVRMTVNYSRIGGVNADLPPNIDKKIIKTIEELNPVLDEVMGLIAKNRIFIDRTKGIGVMTPQDALSFGWTGPCLRASSVSYDVRKAEPYSGYERYDFEIPLGENGDTYDRIMVRFEEMRQSCRIIRQAIDGMPEGDYIAKDRRFVLPQKQEVYNTIEGLINHFKLVIDGIPLPEGEVYVPTEAANGELGFYIVSHGGSFPYRVRCRPPCFYLFSAFPHLIKGHMIADATAILGSLNIIAGELER